MKLYAGPSLFEALDWYNNAPPTWKDKAYTDLKNKIQRIQTKQDYAASRGSKFEAAVERMCYAPADQVTGSDLFKGVVDRCRGGEFQTWTEMYINFEDMRIRIYGKNDVVFKAGHSHAPYGKIIDLKTTGNFRGAEKYRKGWQPRIHCIAENINKFEFIVAEWADEESNALADVYYITADVPDFEVARTEVEMQFAKFAAWLRANNLWDDYVYIHCKNPR